MGIFKFLFGLNEPVNRRRYIQWGFGLMAIKYLGELVLYYLFSNNYLMPWQFLNPVYTQRYPGNLAYADSNLFLFLVALWTLPFLWIGVSMSMRRAINAGLSPWSGLFFFVPIVNFVAMGYLAYLPSKTVSDEKTEFIKPVAIQTDIKLALSCVFGVTFLGIILMWISISMFRTYGVALFLGTPFMLSALQAYFFNYKEQQPLGRTTILGFFTLLLTYFALMLFALEGLICLVMAFPISLMMSLLGSWMGHFLATVTARKAITPLIVLPLIPTWLFIDSATIHSHKDSVVSVMEINAPPEVVWPNVIQFSELPPATEWLFKLGVAHPLRARIEGQGVGAVRYCEFSTGAFVEPITVWKPNEHLQFSVRYQPTP
ncbi:MAG: hypothetical protein K2Q26_14305, partial [Bdellovibrionales bacterium]|nr:hypothetical protein [Bdellovibrionales bacterium]